MNRLKVLVGFVPWAAFSVVSTREGPGGVATAAILAFFVAAAFLVAGQVRRRSPKVLEVTGALVFAVYGMLGVANPPVDAFLDAYGRALATAILALVIVLTLPVLPFTEQYARETVPERYWHSPVFRSVNRRISAAWGGVIAAHAVCAALATVLTEPATTLPTRPVDLVFNWVLPVLLTLWAARYTMRVSAEARDVATAAGAHRTP